MLSSSTQLPTKGQPPPPKGKQLPPKEQPTLPRGKRPSSSEALETHRRKRKKSIRKGQEVPVKEKIVAICIVTADILLVTMYTIIIYKVQAAQNQTKRGKASLVSLLVPVCFMAFTLSYVLDSLFYCEKVSFVSSVLLVANSGCNCFVYFFRGRFMKKTRTRNQ